MVDDESPITGHTTALRRIKYVSSHEVRAGDIQKRVDADPRNRS